MSPKPSPKPSSAPTLQAEKDAILTLLDQGEDTHWQIGQHYNTIVDRGLAQQAGYANAVAFFTKEIKRVPPSTLSRYGAVAKSFPEAAAKQYGCTKLAELLAYEAAAHAGPASGDPGAVQVQVPQKGGAFAAKAFKDCTSAELTAALKALKGEPPLPAEVKAKVAAIQAALDTALGKGHVEVKARLRGRKAVIELGAFDIDQAASVGDALKAG